VFGRRKTTEAETAAEASTRPDGAGKNRPTPKRREAEAARKQPLVPAARSTGKGGGKVARQAAREERVKARERMMLGDERFLMARDRGPVRRFARDYVDARWNLGELLLPVMVIVLALSFVGSGLQKQNPAVYGGVLAVTYTLVVMSAADAFLMGQRLKRAVRDRFGADAETKGLAWYAIMRAFQIRRTRVPRPAVKRGQRPA
jgi:Protein of unknown function (DUF3043)